ncbi:MAG: radical SAM protein [Candidatus Aminicenantales bacterium]
MEKVDLSYESGWYSEEHDGVAPFRWMSQEAWLRLHLPPKKGKKLLRLTAGHSFAPEKPLLKIFVGGKEIGQRAIRPAFSHYFFPLAEEGELGLKFVLDRHFRAAKDSRKLGVMVRTVEVFWLRELEEPLYGEGWYEWEKGELFPFRWMERQATVYLPPTWRSGFLFLPLSSEYFNQRQVLSITWRGKEIANWPLLYQWNTYSLKLPEPGRLASDDGRQRDSGEVAGIKRFEARSKEEHRIFGPSAEAPGEEGEIDCELTFRLNVVFPERFHPEDGRELGIRVGPITWHQDSARHLDLTFLHQNALKNYQEMKEGKTLLSSFPLNLGVDLYARCNVSPPCVYCLYNRMKVMEGKEREAVVDDRTLASYGPFFTAARCVVNCSFGEPLLHPRLEEILEFCVSRGKTVELSTNGQAFTPRTIRALIGKPIYLYVSLDAATAETYAKIRNERFDEIVANLVKLHEGRKKAHGLPKLFMVFMPMRVNFHELEAYFQLCRRLEADSLVLRPLLYLENPGIKEERGGYVFDYEKEILGQEEIKAVISQAEELSRLYGIPVANQFEFGTVREPGRNRALSQPD